ncbi:MFS transporter [Hyphomonas johnsonii]|uniref:Major facilitator transporter n=1 Tax=Hyphomonas johnsonii MHS-2 TaxID=1280950 RepID=A0A059FUS6_9PROT|nr:MFS transporter [Hyphomonas johnsonii]KCZ94266.1 major facilitator transporter [Hyphomonas johnsonii MHS-2]
MTDISAGPKAARKSASARSWYMLALLALVYIIGSVDRAVPSVIVEPLKAEFALTDAQLGFLTGFAYSIPYALAVLPAGWLIDRVDRRALLSIAAAVWSVLTMAGAAAQTFTMLLLARMGVGATEAPASPGSLSLIGDAFPKHRRATAVSLYYAGTAAGQMITFLIGGALLMHFDWRALFLIAGAPGLVLAALLFFTCKEPERGQFDEEQESPEPVSYRLAVRSILASPPLRHAIVANMLATGVNYAILVWTVSFLVRSHGIAVQNAAMTVGVTIGLTMMLGSFVAGWMTDRYAKGDASRTARVPAIGTSIAAILGIAMILMPDRNAAFVLLAAFGFMMGINTGPGYATLVSMTESSMRGAILSIAKLASILIGNGGLAWLTGQLSDWIGGGDSIRWALLITILFLFWASFHFFRAARAQRKESGLDDIL